MNLICYSDETEKIWIKFWPCKRNYNISWKEWHQCKDPLVVYSTDYTKLLLPFFKDVFPLADPTTGFMQDRFDVCGENWIDRSTWYKILAAIETKKVSSEEEVTFYKNFSEWIKKELDSWDIIEVEGNQ